MAEIATATPPDQQQKWYKLQGPDKKWYKLQASSPDEAKAKVTKFASPKPPVTQPAAKAGQEQDKPGYVSEFVSGVGRTASSLLSLPKAILTPHAIESENPLLKSTREQNAALGPTGRLFFNPIADTEVSFEKSAKAALATKQSGEGVAGQILSYLENSMFGGAVKKIEEAGPGYAKFEPATLGGATELSSYAALPKAATTVAKLTKLPVSKALSTYAEKTYDRALDVKPEASGTDPGGHMARLVGPVWSYGQAVKRAQSLIDRITPQIDALVQKASQSKVIITDFDKIVDSVYDPAIKKARAGGDVRLVETLKAEKARASSVIVKDPLTLKEVPQPLNYAGGIDPVVALAKKRAVQTRGWDSGTNETVKALNRQLGHSMAEALDKQIPGLGKLSKQDAALIDAREAAEAAKAKAKVGLKDKLSGMLQAGVPGLAAYGALRLSGAGFGSYFGAAGLMYIWNKLPNATLRASAAARIADLLSDDRMQVPPPKAKPKAGAAAAPSAPPGPGAGPAAPAVGGPGAPGASAGAGPIPAAPAPAAPPSASVAAPVPKPTVDPVTQAATDRALGKTPQEPTGRVAPGTSGVPPQMKKYFDMVDDVLQKLETSKSGLNKAQYQKELGQLKEILNPATSEARRSELADKIDARQRKAASRAKSASEAPVEPSAVPTNVVKETGTKSFEPMDPAMSQEEAMVKLEELYKAFKDIPDAKTYLGALHKMAKDSKMTTAQIYNESLEVYNFLKQNPTK